MQIVHLTYLGMGQFITIDAKVGHVPKIGLMYHWFIMLSYLLAKVRIQFSVDDFYHYSFDACYRFSLVWDGRTIVSSYLTLFLIISKFDI